MTTEKTVHQKLWMSGIPVTRHQSGMIELTQRLPLVSIALGTVGPLVVVLAGSVWFDVPPAMLIGFVFLTAIMALLCATYIAYILRQPPIISYDPRTRQLHVPRMQLVLDCEQIERIGNTRRRASDGEGGTYAVATLSLISHTDQDGQLIYVTNRIRNFDCAWETFLQGVRGNGQT